MTQGREPLLLYYAKSNIVLALIGVALGCRPVAVPQPVGPPARGCGVWRTDPARTYTSLDGLAQLRTNIDNHRQLDSPVHIIADACVDQYTSVFQNVDAMTCVSVAESIDGVERHGCRELLIEAVAQEHIDGSSLS